MNGKDMVAVMMAVNKLDGPCFTAKDEEVTSHTVCPRNSPPAHFISETQSPGWDLIFSFTEHVSKTQQNVFPVSFHVFSFYLLFSYFMWLLQTFCFFFLSVTDSLTRQRSNTIKLGLQNFTMIAVDEVCYKSHIKSNTIDAASVVHCQFCLYAHCLTTYLLYFPASSVPASWDPVINLTNNM